MGLRVGTGIGLGIGGPPWSPGASLVLAYEAVAGKLLDGSGVAVTDGGIITTWKATAGPDLTVTGAGLTWDAANKAVVMDGTHYFTLPTPVVVPGNGSNNAKSSYYSVCTPNNSGNVYVLGNASVSCVVGAVGEALNFADDTGNAANNNAGIFTGGLIRDLRQNPSGSGNVTQATNVPAVTDAIAGDITVGVVGAYLPIGNSLAPSPAGSRLTAVLVFNVDTVAANLDAGVRAYLFGRYGVSL